MTAVSINRLGRARLLGSQPSPGVGSNLYLPGSFVQTPLPSNAPLETDPTLNGTAGGKQSYATRLANQANYSTSSTPASSYSPPYQVVVNESSYSIPVYIVPPGHATAKVWYVDGSGTAQAAGAANNLQAVLSAVPVPIGTGGSRFDQTYGVTVGSSGYDGECVFYKPDTDELWEFYAFTWAPARSRYECQYAAYLPSASANNGRLPNGWGARACSIAASAGVLMISELASGVIPHAVAVEPCVTGPGALLPATRYDSQSQIPSASFVDEVPDGAMFRFPATLTVPGGISTFAAMLITAIRDFGMYVCDASGVVSFQAEDPRTVGTPYNPVTTNPLPTLVNYTNLTTEIPWSSLQQLKVPSA